MDEAVQNDWRRTNAVIGVQMRGAMLCEPGTPYEVVGDRRDPRVNASRCFHRFDWAGCVRSLQAKAVSLGYAGARVYLATEMAPLRTQAERAFGEILAPPPANRGSYGESSSTSAWRVAMQELITDRL